MFEGMEPGKLRKWLILAGVVYLVLPMDLIPDVLGLPGRIDDVVAMGLLTWFYRNHMRRWVEDHAEREGARESAASGAPAGDALDAYDILEVTRSASPEAIKTAYRARMREYHPDKVAHLGDELQKLAHEKAQQIQRAYEDLTR